MQHPLNRTWTRSFLDVIAIVTAAALSGNGWKKAQQSMDSYKEVGKGTAIWCCTGDHNSVLYNTDITANEKVLRGIKWCTHTTCFI